MGKSFRRDRASDGANAMLNYGYTVLRALTARTIVAAGLHPSLGLHHHHPLNPMALADDLMEPFRPLVDATVHALVQDGHNEVDGDVKARLTAFFHADLPAYDRTSPMDKCLSDMVYRVAQSFIDKEQKLAVFTPPSPWEWQNIASGKSGGGGDVDGDGDE